MDVVHGVTQLASLAVLTNNGRKAMDVEFGYCNVRDYDAKAILKNHGSDYLNNSIFVETPYPSSFE